MVGWTFSRRASHAVTLTHQTKDGEAAARLALCRLPEGLVSASKAKSTAMSVMRLCTVTSTSASQRCRRPQGPTRPRTTGGYCTVMVSGAAVVGSSVSGRTAWFSTWCWPTRRRAPSPSPSRTLHVTSKFSVARPRGTSAARCVARAPPPPPSPPPPPLPSIPIPSRGDCGRPQSPSPSPSAPVSTSIMPPPAAPPAAAASRRSASFRLISPRLRGCPADAATACATARRPASSRAVACACAACST